MIASDASDDLIALARKNAIPVVSTLNGLGAFPPDDPLFLGMLGMHAMPYTNMIIEEADLLLAFGVRFDDRATGKVAEFCPHAAIAHVDIDHSEIDKLRTTNLGIVADVGETLRQLLPLVAADERTHWNQCVAEIRARFPQAAPEREDPLRPLNFIDHLSELLAPETIVTTDVGQHQMWVAQAYPFRRPRTLLTSGGLGTMGFGMPAAIGAALANPGGRVVCISGDGSLLMNIQELATLAELALDVSIIVMNNNHLGLVRQQQELFYGERYHASRFDSRPDFVAIANGFGLRGYDLGRASSPIETVAGVLSEPGPSLINVPVHQTANVYPMVPPGGANHEMIGTERVNG